MRQSSINSRSEADETYRRELWNGIRPRLKKLSKGTQGEWKALCPYHDDHNPSLSVNPRKGTFFCFACGAKGSTTGLANILGVSLPSQEPSRSSQTFSETHYTYTDESGTDLFQVVRTMKNGRKSFFQRHSNGNGGWINGIKGVRRVLYQLPAVREAIETGMTVFLVEGEKDVDRLTDEGLTATTCPMGAGKWRDEYADTLSGADVVILPDNDEPGRAHAEQVARSLNGKAGRIRVVHLPDLPEKGDVSDWLDAGNSIENLMQITSAAPDWKPHETPLEPKPVERLHLTDMGNAERLVRRHGKDLKYDHITGMWYVWNGRSWEPDATSEVFRRAKETALQIYVEAAECPLDEERSKIVKWAKSSESRSRIADMVSMASSEPGIPVQEEEFDVGDWILNCDNGTIDLKTGELKPHNRDDLLTRIIHTSYDPTAKHHTWNSFLNKATGGSTELREYLQQAIGYSLIGGNEEDMFMFVYGPPRTGKSTFFEAITAALGQYTMMVDFEVFLKRKDTGGPRGELVDAQGTRLMLSSETERGRQIAEGILKQITGGDTISARKIYQSHTKFRPTYTPWLIANDEPGFPADDDAVWRRVKTIPFESQLRPDQVDPNIRKRLSTDPEARKAVLAWAVEGCLKWQQAGQLHTPKIITDATTRLRESIDPFDAFFNSDYVSFEDPNAFTSTADIYNAYERWCREEKISEKDVLTKNALGKALKSRGYKDYRKPKARGFIGVLTDGGECSLHQQ